MIRFVYYALFFVIVAGLTHIGSLLAIPAFAERDAWAKLSASAKPWTFVRIAAPDQRFRPIGGLDPAMHVAACRFDLRKSGVSITAEGRLPHWSVSIYDRRGNNVYSFNDRTAVNRQLYVIAVDEVQMAKLRSEEQSDIEQAVLIEAPIEEGFVFVRALEEDPSWRGELDRFFNSARCEPLVVPDS